MLCIKLIRENKGKFSDLAPGSLRVTMPKTIR